MTTNDIQAIVFKYIVGRYYKLSINEDRIVDNSPEMKGLSMMPSFVVQARMCEGDFMAFRKDCHEAGLDIIAIWDESDNFTIIATERM